LFLETCTAVVSSGRAISRRRQAFSDRGSGPQGLRRPRFSFFRFTCQTARDPCGSRSPKRRGAAEAQDFRHDRTPGHTAGEELRRRAIAPKSGRRAVVGALYGRGHRVVNCQRAKFPRNFALWREPFCACATGLSTQRPRRTGATFLPRCSVRGKASGDSSNQRRRGDALTRRRWRGIVPTACC
jgi:hypothetical protein